MTTITVQAIKDYIKDNYPDIGSSGVVMVDVLSGRANEYAIIPQPGPKIIREYINGASERQFLFALQMMAYTADDAKRIANNGFFEAIDDWFEAQTLAEELPTLNDNQTARKIGAIQLPFLYREGESEISIYQMNCTLEYHQDAP